MNITTFNLLEPYRFFIEHKPRKGCFNWFDFRPRYIFRKIHSFHIEIYQCVWEDGLPNYNLYYRMILSEKASRHYYNPIYTPHIMEIPKDDIIVIK